MLTGTEPFVRYEPNANFHGDDSITFVANDGRADSEPAIVALSITPVNDPPVASDDAGFTSPDTAVVLPVLDNDDDVDGDPLVVASVTPPRERDRSERRRQRDIRAGRGVHGQGHVLVHRG